MASNNFKDVIAQYFKPGASVEISSEEEGFSGSWYEGTVIREMKKDKLLVEYKDLLDDDGKQKLREELNAVQLRPIPPRESLDRSFNVNEDVDCFHNDGWWEGVITEVLEDGSYSVYFRSSREQMKYQRRDIRLHREWLHGDWNPPLEVKPEDQSMSLPVKVEPCKEVVQESIYQGARVEISSDEDGFAGAWFAATIIEQLDENRYLIQYESLRNDNNTDFEKEEVDRLHIRPYPPNCPVDSFKLFDEVDALYNDGWWVGIISEALDNQNYKVYFRGTKELMKFKDSELRIHQDWIDGKWVIPSQALQLQQ